MIAALRKRILLALDPHFPPDPSAYMVGEALTDRELKQASESMGGYLAELRRTDVDVLDFGCGWGGETMWLADRVKSAVGVDVVPESIETANQALARSPRTNCRFACAPDGRLPFPDGSFDAVFSTNVFEHVIDLDLAFSELFRVLKPAGTMLTRFGPLFYSPFGYHLYWACAVPYAHVLFGLPAVLHLRNTRCDSPYEATNWQQMGLNQRRFGEYRRRAARAGFELVRFERIPVRGLHTVAKLPWLGDFFTFGIDAHLRKPAAR